MQVRISTIQRWYGNQIFKYEEETRWQFVGERGIVNNTRTHTHSSSLCWEQGWPCISVQCWHLVVTVGLVSPLQAKYFLCVEYFWSISEILATIRCLQVEVENMAHRAQASSKMRKNNDHIVPDYTCGDNYASTDETYKDTHADKCVSSTASGFTNNPLTNRKVWRLRRANVPSLHAQFTFYQYSTWKVQYVETTEIPKVLVQKGAMTKYYNYFIFLLIKPDPTSRTNC